MGITLSNSFPDRYFLTVSGLSPLSEEVHIMAEIDPSEDQPHHELSRAAQSHNTQNVEAIQRTFASTTNRFA